MGFFGILEGFLGFSWDIWDFEGLRDGILQDCIGFLWILEGFLGFSWDIWDFEGCKDGILRDS